jgi:hypothetical protein
MGHKQAARLPLPERPIESRSAEIRRAQAWKPGMCRRRRRSEQEFYMKVLTWKKIDLA